MIILRYVTKQILLACAAISMVLLTIVSLGRLANYLNQSALGEINPNALLLLIFFKMPEFIQLILPLGLMLSILLTYGRMHAENEMIILSTSGVSQKRILAATYLSTMIITGIVAIFALKITPLSLVYTDTLLEQQKELNEFDFVSPGLFQSFSKGQRTTYAESIVDGQMTNVFMYDNTNGRIIVSDTAIIALDEAGDRYVKFDEGSITTQRGDEADFVISRFREMGVRLENREAAFNLVIEERGMQTSNLLGTGNPSYIAELQWRLSLIMLAPVLTLLALPLSRVNPRQGRFGKLVPAIIIYLLYFGMLLVSRDLVSKNLIGPVIGMWWVHLVFLIVGLLLFNTQMKTPFTPRVLYRFCFRFGGKWKN